jgi:hypothetical protein
VIVVVHQNSHQRLLLLERLLYLILQLLLRHLVHQIRSLIQHRDKMGRAQIFLIIVL